MCFVEKIDLLCQWLVIVVCEQIDKVWVEVVGFGEVGLQVCQMLFGCFMLGGEYFVVVEKNGDIFQF